MKRYLIIAVSSATILCAFVFIPEISAAREVNMEIVAPNEMTPEMSRRIYQRKQLIKGIIVAIPAVVVAMLIVKVLHIRKKGLSPSPTTKQKKVISS